MNVDLCLKRKYKKGTNELLAFSGHRLAQELGAYIRIPRKLPNSSNDQLLNWGKTTITGLERYTNILNHPEAVKLAVDKLECLRYLNAAGVSCLDFCTTLDMAKVLMYNDPDVWFICRTLLKSSSGKGIVLAKSPEDLVQAPLYTVYYKKKVEFRYHIFQGRVIDIQQKKRLSTEELALRGFTERPPSYIRNLANGYIFARGNIHYYPEVATQSILAVESLGLDFGAVDILVNTDDHDNYVDCAVCEVNTAPGLTGTTFDLYVQAFKEYYEELL